MTIYSSAKAFFAYNYFCQNNKNILFCSSDEEAAITSYKQMLFFAGKNNEQILYFPSLDTLPYDRTSPNNNILSQRANVLTILAKSETPKIVITSAANLLTKLPPSSTFADATLEVKKGMELGVDGLAKFLVKNGFQRVPSAVDSGEFAVKGEIADLVTHSNIGYRINFGWNKVEAIRRFDTYSQVSKGSLGKITLSPSSEILLNNETISNFRKNFLRSFGVNYIDSPLYKSIIEEKKFHGYEHLAPLFYGNMNLMYDFLGEHTIIYDNLCIQAMLEYEHSYNELYESRLLSNKSNPDSFYFALPVDKFIDKVSITKEILAQDTNLLLDNVSEQSLTSIPNIASKAKIEHKTEFDASFELILNNKRKIIVILCSSSSGLSRIKHISEEYEYVTNEISYLSEARKNTINLTIAPLTQGFFSNKYLFISEQDILGSKSFTQTQGSSKRKLKNILTELDNISEGELVVHKEYGIGMFEKIHTISLDNTYHDCLKIIYANNDILYLPVENIEQIKKFGSHDAPLDKLGGASWQKRKSQLKNRIKDIAASLIKITAERHLAKTDSIDLNKAEYEKFCSLFPYSETEDQLSSINDIKTDLESGNLMDRLICGDVGFGKTEVAMRAAFMTAYDMNADVPQICIISPTTILCRQHYVSFLERFKDTGLKIAQLSRLIRLSNAMKIKDDLANGKINIIIGTHSLLASSIKFKNLKMLIIDEEQHFGVAQKEHLKRLKTGVHVLSLSATPIPRTLQMSMVGIKDLSLITTPPIDRLPVRTNLMPFDQVVLREALMRERFRGGLSFYVVPRIKDIEWVEKQLKQIVPELKYRVAHGQMSASKIDEVMTEFCDGKFDILLSTTIIESGIDIPIANTIIIHKANMLGLSQLYQLRGRVGRGKVRGYAYLTLLPNKIIPKHSLQRLEILQNIDSLGAGFTISSHDMDLRGFGNLVGSEQSGHIKEVGTELYQEMLDEAINELKAKETQDVSSDFIPSINLSISVLIPSSYIENSSLRLAIYRRAGDLKTNTEIEHFKDEMIDRFGPMPEEFSNLLNIVKIKNTCKDLKIESLDTGPNGFVMKFNENFDVSDMVMKFIQKHPRHAKMKPDNKLVFLQPLKTETLLQETEKLLKEL